MTRKYVRHPSGYDVGGNEKLYAHMAAQGWLLEKRGYFLSRLRNAAPAQLRYRIEFGDRTTAAALPTEQVALYEACGWHYVTGTGWVHVFSAPVDSDAPAIYTDPVMQADTLKGYRNRSSLSGFLVTATIGALLIFVGKPGSGSFLETLKSIAIMPWITQTASYLLFLCFFVWALYAFVREKVYTRRLYRRLRRGSSIDHAPKSRRLPHKIVSFILLACCTASLALSITQWAQHREYDMPAAADGPYFLLRDLGFDGERTTSHFVEKSNSVEYKRSLLSDQWFTYEVILDDGGQNRWMYQDIYILHDIGLVEPFLPALLQYESRFSLSDFKPIAIPGLDAAYEGRHECIAVKGTTIYLIRTNTQETPVDILEQLVSLSE